MGTHAVVAATLFVLAAASSVRASGHGPVFGAATPTLGRGGWSLDQLWTMRTDDDGERQEMLRTMLSFGITENLQLSGSLPVSIEDGHLAPGRMMGMMSGAREVEGLVVYRFHVNALGIGARRESTVYVGGTVPLESRRDGMATAKSLEVGVATGYASRAHYVWVGGGLQHFGERDGHQLGASTLLTFVYGYRPPALRTEPGKPDLRFFVEATAEDRRPNRMGEVKLGGGARTIFVGPTALVLHKAIGLAGGVLFPLYQGIDSGQGRERMRVAFDFSYFFWLK
jgi:hypothetical protein